MGRGGMWPARGLGPPRHRSVGPEDPHRIEDVGDRDQQQPLVLRPGTGGTGGRWVMTGTLRYGTHLRTPVAAVVLPSSAGGSSGSAMAGCGTSPSPATTTTTSTSTPPQQTSSYTTAEKTAQSIQRAPRGAGDLPGKYAEGQSTRDPASQWYHEALSNDELLDSINNADEGEGIVVSQEGWILGGNHRMDELLTRVGDGSIHPDQEILIQVLGDG